MTASLKLRTLEAKISELQAHHQTLLKQRHLEIAQDISRLNLAYLDHRKLMGALLFIGDKIITNDPIAEDWLKAGEKFLRRKKSTNRSKSEGDSKTACQANPTNQPS